MQELIILCLLFVIIIADGIYVTIRSYPSTDKMKICDDEYADETMKVQKITGPVTIGVGVLGLGFCVYMILKSRKATVTLLSSRQSSGKDVDVHMAPNLNTSLRPKSNFGFQFY